MQGCSWRRAQELLWQLARQTPPDGGAGDGFQAVWCQRRGEDAGKALGCPRETPWWAPFGGPLHGPQRSRRNCADAVIRGRFGSMEFLTWSLGVVKIGPDSLLGMSKLKPDAKSGRPPSLGDIGDVGEEGRAIFVLS